MVADINDPIHVRDMTTHVGKEKKSGAALFRLAIQIAKVNGVIFLYFHQNDPAARVFDGSGNRSQRVGIT